MEVAESGIRIVTGKELLNLDNLNRLFRSVGFGQKDGNYFTAVLNSETCTAVRNSELIGFGRAVNFLDAAYLYDVCVDPKYRGRGIGTDIVTNLILRYEGRSKSVRLTPSSRNVVGFYENIGFRYVANNEMEFQLR